jgi:TrmH family RNA methyltransferase
MQILSQALAKQIRLLHQKKYREIENLFLVEGGKPVLELLGSDWKIRNLICTETFLEKNNFRLQNPVFPIHLCDEAQLSFLSNLETNRDALALVEKPENPQNPNSENQLWLVLDQISDPGNLGTIIRLADWFGLLEVITVGPTVEWYNPKVINASKGSFLRVRQVKSDISFILNSGRTIYPADMNGQSLHEFTLPAKPFVFVIGQESHGISPEWKKPGISAVTIPSFGKAESLNAAMATGILLNHWRYLQQT